MVVSKESDLKAGIYRIKDPGTQFLTFGAMLIFPIISVMFLEDPSPSMSRRLFGLAVIIAITIGLYFRLLAIWDGVELNLSRRTMCFPGGGNAANEITDYVNPDFLLQLFKRKTINLDEISDVSPDDEVREYYDKEGKYHKDIYYYILFVGTFGATKLRFRSQGKRNELCNAIRLANKMGTPVFEA